MEEFNEIKTAKKRNDGNQREEKNTEEKNSCRLQPNEECPKKKIPNLY